MVKVYTTGGNTDKVEIDTAPELNGDKLVIKTPDSGYNYKESTQSPEDKDVTSWEEVPAGDTTTDNTLPIKPETNGIYIHYDKDPGTDTGILLHENEISKQFNLSLANNGTLVNGIRTYDSVSVSDIQTIGISRSQMTLTMPQTTCLHGHENRQTRKIILEMA